MQNNVATGIWLLVMDGALLSTLHSSIWLVFISMEVTKNERNKIKHSFQLNRVHWQSGTDLLFSSCIKWFNL